MTGLTGLTVWGETVKKVKTVRTKNYMPLLPLLPVPKLCLILKYVDTKKGVVMDKRLKKFTIADRLSNALCCAPTSWHTTEALEGLSGTLSTKSVQHLSINLGWMSTNLVQL